MAWGVIYIPSHISWYLKKYDNCWSSILFAKGYTNLPRGLEMSCLLIVNATLLVNTSILLKWVFFYSMTFSLAHWGTWVDNYMFTVFNRKTLLSMLMPNVKCLENGQLVAHWYNLGRHRPYNSVEHTNAKCHVLTLMVYLLIITIT